MESQLTLNPERDGIDHINIYSRGATWLGREASNFSRCRMVVPDHGTFNSIEGYWYWLLTGYDHLRALTGHDAKKIGRETLKRNPGVRPDDFESRIKTAIREKVRQNLDLSRALADSTLPFTHYYVMTNRHTGQSNVIDANNHPWLIHEWECIRAELRGEPKPELMASSTSKADQKDDQLGLF